MERMQSVWENRVEVNLAESGVQPLALNELLKESEIEGLLGISLGYPQTNGSQQLRDLIANAYQGARRENILVTNGTAEANMTAAWLTGDRPARVLLVVPNYMQLYGIFEALGAEVVPVWLREEEKRWSLDLGELERQSRAGADVISVCNPNNPTGAILNQEERSAIIRAAEKTGAWLIVDEVYQGAEIDGRTTPSFWGSYPRTIVTAGLSKAYGLPGLRIGWLAAPEEVTERAWSWHDYSTISISMTSDFLARIALQPERKKQLLSRTREILETQLPVLREWVSRRDECRLFGPEGGAIAFVGYEFNLDSVALVERLRDQESLLIVPGDHFLVPGHLRIGFGYSLEKLEDGLKRLSRFWDSELLGVPTR